MIFHNILVNCDLRFCMTRIAHRGLRVMHLQSLVKLQKSLIFHYFDSAAYVCVSVFVNIKLITISVPRFQWNANEKNKWNTMRTANETIQHNSQIIFINMIIYFCYFFFCIVMCAWACALCCAALCYVWTIWTRFIVNREKYKKNDY